jgi:hypothetical protein
MRCGALRHVGARFKQNAWRYKPLHAGWNADLQADGVLQSSASGAATTLAAGDGHAPQPSRRQLP